MGLHLVYPPGFVPPMTHTRPVMAIQPPPFQNNLNLGGYGVGYQI